MHTLNIFIIITSLISISDQDITNVLPEGYGLSAKYPGDINISSDPSIIFAENFESGDLDEIQKHWSSVSNKDGKVIFLSNDKPQSSSGKYSIQMVATLGENTGGHLYKSFSEGVDKVFARFYVKFPEDAEYIHHFVHLGGYNPPTPWPQGGAGERPQGHERITVGIEPTGNYGKYPAPGIWNFYVYWHEMKISADGRYWGNSLNPIQPAIIPKNQWICVEVMLKMNSAPEIPDGELALWIDGKLIANFIKGIRRSKWTGMGFSIVEKDGEQFEGFRWRNDNDLKINFFWLLHYVTENALRQNRVNNPNPINRVWFDDIVISKNYIAPIYRIEVKSE